MNKTHLGRTSTGAPVHARTIDHHKPGFNKFIAVVLTAKVGNMRCFWAFCVLALLSLPATLHEAGAVGAHWLGIPSFFMSFGFIFLDAWVCQNFIQLVLLPALMVGQNLQNEASDVRAAKQFEDTELVVDRLNTATQGGLTEVLEAVHKTRADLANAMTTVRSIVAPPASQVDVQVSTPGTAAPAATAAVTLNRAAQSKRLSKERST